MTLATAPNLIEVSDFSAGWQPDVEPAALPPNALVDVLNLLPDVGSNTPQVRKGFKRITGAVVQGYRVEAVHTYNRISGGNEGQYLIIVATVGTDNVADNVKVYAHNLGTGVTTLISPALRVFPKGDGRHGGATILGKFYGFPPGGKAYAWSPGTGWEDDPTTPTFRVWNENGEYDADSIPHDFAFVKGNEVLYTDPINGQRAYSADRRIVYITWKSGVDYRKGQRVTRKADWPGAPGNYRRSFICKKRHDSDATNRPGDGSGSWQTYWRLVTLTEPANDDGEVGIQWNLIPTAPQTNIVMWHADRLFARYDNVGTIGRSRLQFSPPSKPKKGDDISTLTWDPKDWRVGNLKGEAEKEGDGGGWEDFRTGDGDGITALWSYGQYLLVFKRKSTWVIAGTNRRTWNKRLVGQVGCIGPRAVCEHEGIVYFVGDEGFYRTDGAQLEEVPGAERIRDWLRAATNWEGSPEGDVQMWSFGGFVWMSVPTNNDKRPSLTIVYNPDTEAFWPTDLKVQAATINRVLGLDQLFFSMPGKVGNYATATYAWLGTPRRSQSTRTILSVTETNLFANPSFEPQAGETPQQATASSGWSGDTDIKFYCSVKAKRRGRLGMVVKNYIPKGQVGTYKGLYRNFADTDATQHTVAGYFRRPDWKKRKKLDYSMVKWSVGSDIAEGNHTFTYIGRGWWLVSATYTGDAAARDHRFKIEPGRALHVDSVLCVKGALVPYFDGDGGEAPGDHNVEGGDWAMVHQYDHADIRDAPTDDTGAQNYASEPIPWEMQTAWFPFGALREDRRIRRIWSLVRGAVSTTLRGYRNFDEQVEFEVEQVPSQFDPATFFEGRMMPDAYAVSVGVEGLGAPVGILGVAVDTQPRRVRYHVA